MRNPFLLLYCFFILLLVIYSFFLKDIPISIWDEAVYVNDAIEISKGNGMWINIKDPMQPLYNTKPPLGTWLQSICISVFGINELAVRIPSILSIAGIILALMVFLKRQGHGLMVQCLVVLTLLTSKGFMGFHVGATADLDAMLCFWTTLFSLTVFDIILKDSTEEISKKLWLAGLFFLGGFFTKSTAMFLVLPGLFACMVYSKKTRLFFFNRHTYWVLIACMVVVSGYYLYLNRIIPGYFSTAWFSEVERFYRNIMPWHEQPWNFYITNLLYRFSPWIYFILPLSFVMILNKSKNLKRTGILSIIFSFIYVVVVSIPSVKLEWYDAPIYPFLSLITGPGLYVCLNFIKKRFGKKIYSVLAIGFIALYLVIFYSIISSLVKSPADPLEREGNFIREVFKKHQPAHSKVVMQVEHAPHYEQLHFYRKKYLAESGSAIDIKPSVMGLNTGDTVFVCQQEKKDSIASLYLVDTMIANEECMMLVVKANKN